MTHSRSKPWLLLVLIALGLRAFYVPIHLAQEEHFWVAAPTSADEHGHAHEPATHADAGHAGDCDDHHAPHPALDHAVELIAQRVHVHPTCVELSALPVGEAWSLPIPDRVFATVVPERRTSIRWLRPPRRSRGPPAAA